MAADPDNNVNSILTGKTADERAPAKAIKSLPALEKKFDFIGRDRGYRCSSFCNLFCNLFCILSCVI